MSQALNLANFANKLNTSGQTDNTGLQNSSVTVTAGTGMSGGGAVALGSSVTLTNSGVTSVTAGTGISVSATTGGITITNTSPGGGGVTSAVAGNGVAVSASTGAVTFSASCPTAGSVGSYCCIYLPGTSGSFTPTFGSNYAAGTGNQQVQTGAMFNNSDSFLQQQAGGGLSGTWKYLGVTTQVSTSGTNTGAVVALGCRVA